jgi:hypothetical protein
LNRLYWQLQLGVGFDGHFSIGLNLQSIITFLSHQQIGHLGPTIQLPHVWHLPTLSI